MKKRYEKPTVEVVKFQYRDQVVVASSGGTGICEHHYTDATTPYCYDKLTGVYNKFQWLLNGELF